MTSSHPNAPDVLQQSLSGDPLPDVGRSLALLANAQQGDDAALEELIARYQDRLRRIVRIQLGASFLRRDYDSMDIVQSTFQSALPKIGDLRPQTTAGLLQWLSLIATNKIRDAYDRMTADKRDMRREVPLDSPSHVGPANSTGAPDQRAFLNEVRELLDEQVALLPEDQRRVVLLRDYCGEDWTRIAAELDRDAGAARQLHQRAWIRLRSALRPRLSDPGDRGSSP